MDNEELERLSAFVDGEVAPEETDRLLDTLTGDARARHRLSEYHRLGEAIRCAYRSMPIAAQTGLPERLERLVAEEDAQSAGGRDHRGTVTPLRPVAGSGRRRTAAAGRLAVAAAVVAAAGLGFLIAKQLSGPGPERSAGGPERLAAVELPPAPAPAVTEETQTPSGGWDVEDPSVQQRLRGYLVNHSEYAGGSLRSLHPYVRVVTYEEGR